MNKRTQKRIALQLTELLAKGSYGDLAGLANELHAATQLWKPEDETANKIIDALTIHCSRVMQKEIRQAKYTLEAI